MRKRNYRAVLAAGMTGVALLAGGCASQTPAETAVAEVVKEEGTGAAESTAAAEESKDTAAGNETEASAPAPGPVKFDMENGYAVSGVGGADGESGAAAGEEADISVPLRIWGTVLSAEENEIVVDNQSDVSSKGEMILHIDPEQTLVLDAVNGLPVELADVQKGSFEAYLGPAMTMSLPPQSTAYVVIVNIPPDAAAPQYAVAVDAIRTEDGAKVLAANDGREYTLAEEVEILPYLTKNIVSLEDIKEGSRCLVWQNGDELVEKIVLFADQTEE